MSYFILCQSKWFDLGDELEQHGEAHIIISLDMPNDRLPDRYKLQGMNQLVQARRQSIGHLHMYEADD